MEATEKGIVWQGLAGGVWAAKGIGGQYQLVPRKQGGGFRAWYLASDGGSVDLGPFDDFPQAASAAAAYNPATGKVEYPSIRPAAAEDCGCQHKHPPEVPTVPCPDKENGAPIGHAAEEGRVTTVVYEKDPKSVRAPAAPLRWHRTKTGYESAGRMGAYTISSRKADRRHGIKPIVLEIRGVGSAIYQFDTKTAAQDFAQAYDGQSIARRSSAAEEAPRGQPMATLRVPMDVDTRGLRAQLTPVFPGAPTAPVSGRTVPDQPFEELPPAGAPPAGKSGSRKGAPRQFDPAAFEPKTVSQSIHWVWNDKSRAYRGVGRSGKIYEVSVKGRPPQWTLSVDGKEKRGRFPYVERAIETADQLEGTPLDQEPPTRPEGVRRPGASEAPLLPVGTPPITTLKRDFKRLEACQKAAEKIGPITGPKQIWQLLAKQLLREAQEVFVVVPLNIHDQLADCPIEVHRGAHARVDVDSAVVLNAALVAAVQAAADAYIVVHQHPGARPDPSEADIELTATLEKATVAVGGGKDKQPGSLEFKGHYIISAEGVYDIGSRKMWYARGK